MICYVTMLKIIYSLRRVLRFDKLRMDSLCKITLELIENFGNVFRQTLFLFFRVFSLGFFPESLLHLLFLLRYMCHCRLLLFLTETS